MNPEKDKLLEILQQPGSEKRKSVLKDFSTLFPADIAEIINRLNEKRKKIIFSCLSPELASDVLLELDEKSKFLIIEDVDDKKLISIVEEMESDDAADFIADLPKEDAKNVLSSIPAEESIEVKKLLEYPEDSAGGIMQTELVSMRETSTVREAISRVKSISTEVEDIHNVFVVNRNGKLTGILPINRLLLHPSNTPVKRLMNKDPIAVKTTVDQEEVALIFKKYDLISLPVVDIKGKLTGRILVDDIVDVLEEEASEDILTIAGTDEEELLFSHTIFKVAGFRLPWLIYSLAGGLITGSLIWIFKITLKEVISLAVFIPVIMGMGGNVGTQSSAIVVRGLATGRINISNFVKLLLKECGVGLFMGLICGSIAGLIARMWHGDPWLGIVVGFSMFLAIFVAALLGSMIPMIFHHLKIDPAIAAGPIVLAINDIVGLLIFFGLATMLLGFIH